MTSRSVLWLRDRPKLWIASCLIVAAAVGIPRVLSSRFVSERRVAHGLQRARAQLAAREFEQVRRELRGVLRLEPGNGDARNQLANIELALGNREIAFLEFQTLTEMQPRDPNGWIGIAELMFKGGLLDAPESALDKAIGAAPARADARLLRGEIRFRVGRYHGARVDAERALAEAPRDPASWGLLVRSAARSQGAAAGVEAAERGIAAIGREPVLVLPLASLMGERGRAREATKLLKEVVAMPGGAGAAWNPKVAIARVELRAGDREAARKQLDDVLREQPADEEAIALRSVLDAAAGRLQPSLARLDAALQAAPKSRTLRDVRARLQAARPEPAAVTTLLAELAERDLGPQPVPAARLRAEAQPAGEGFGAAAREHWPGRMAQIRQALEVDLRQQDWTDSQRIVESAGRAYPQASSLLHEAMRARPKRS